MILETSRLILRPFNDGDLEDIFEYAKVEEVGLNAGWIPHTTKEDTSLILDMFINDTNTFAIVYKENNKVIGSISFGKDYIRSNVKSKCLGYVLSKDYWGMGLMTEAAKKMLEYGFFVLDLDIISIAHFTDNIRSKRVIEKCGFVYEGTIRKGTLLYNGKIKDKCIYSLDKIEFIKNNSL